MSSYEGDRKEQTPNMIFQNDADMVPENVRPVLIFQNINMSDKTNDHGSKYELDVK